MYRLDWVNRLTGEDSVIQSQLWKDENENDEKNFIAEKGKISPS